MSSEPARSQADRERRLALARQAFRDFYAQCFWSWDPEAAIDEDHIPGIVQGLREFGGHAGYRIVAQLWP